MNQAESDSQFTGLSESEKFKTIFDMYRLLCLMVPFCGFVLSFVYIMRSTCKNARILLVILTTGLVIEVFITIDIHEVGEERDPDLNIYMPSCQYHDFQFILTFANGLILSLLILPAIKRNFPSTQSRLCLRNSIQVTLMIGCAVMYKFSRYDKTSNPTQPSVMTYGKLIFYNGICQENPDVAKFMMEMGLIYLPLFTTFLIVLYQTRNKKSEEFRILSTCSSKMSKDCSLCTDLHSLFKMAIFVLMLLYLIVRPILFFYHYVRHALFRDMIPAYSILLYQVIIIIQCIKSVFSKTKKQPNVENFSYINDNTTDV